MQKKKTLALIALFVSIVLVSCSKLKDLGKVTFDIPNNQSVVIPNLDSMGVVVPTGGFTFTFPTIWSTINLSDSLTKYNTNADKIDSVMLKALSMQLTNSGTFDFVDTLRVYLVAPGQSTGTLMAYQYGGTAGQTTVTLTPVDENLKQYFLADSLGLQLQAHLIALPPSNATLNVSSKFTVYANLLN